MIATTLNRIRAHSPCGEGWAKLLAGLGKIKADDEMLPFATIVKINGIDDAVWCCRAEPQYDREWRLFAVWCARQVQHLMTDTRSVTALDAAERYANGEATDAELFAAQAAAQDAARAAAQDAAWVAARDAARVAAWVAAWDAARDAARAAAREALWVAARAAARDAQIVEFLRLVNETPARAALAEKEKKP